MNFDIITIDGREAIPVRAIPFITAWKMPPDKVAAVMSHEDLFFQTPNGEPIPLTAYYLVDGKPHPILPEEWNGVLEAQICTSLNLVADAWDTAAKIAKSEPERDTEPLPYIDLSEWLELSPEECEQRMSAHDYDLDPNAHIRQMAHQLTRVQWKREAVGILPAGVFVWRDDFEQAFHRVYASILIVDEKPGARELNISPWVQEELRHAGVCAQGQFGVSDTNEGATIALAGSGADGKQANVVTAKPKGGRPKTIGRKACILSQLIDHMAKGKVIEPGNLPGTAADLLDACQRIEKSMTGKNSTFSTSEDTFKTWLKSSGYGFKGGRAPNHEAHFWTQLCVKTMRLMDEDIFTEVIDKTTP